MQLVLLSGLSGAGKSIALHVLEDAGCYCVDNLPAPLLTDLINHLHYEDHKYVAVAVDMPVVARVGWQPFDAVYRTGPPLEVKSPVLKDLAEKYTSTIAALPLNGDDWGSLKWSGGRERSVSIGCNRKVLHARVSVAGASL